MTLTSVTISIILDRSQIDAEFLIQVERNEKTLKRIQKKVVRAMSGPTLDWSQSNNNLIFCYAMAWRV